MVYLFGNEAEPEDKGGFCDKDSAIHYCNESKEETLNQAAKFEEHGDSDIQTKDGRGAKDCPESSRFNTTILETDDQGSRYPSRYEPGR